MGDRVTVEILDAGNAVEVHVGAGGSIPSKWSVWNEETDYVPLRSVTHLGSAYVCIKACTGVDPEADVVLGDGVEGEYWIKTASKGDTGATPNLQMGTVETLEPEQAAKATITGTAEDPILNLQLPKGKQGDTGATPNLQMGTVETLEPEEVAKATITGTAEDPILNLQLPKGDTGATPRLQMGTVETLEPEEAAKATITGTAEEPILNLQLPKGRQGAAGSPGKDGVDGIPGKDGAPGKDGKDGVSVTHSWNGTVLNVTSASGTSSADLRGPAGADGKDGQGGNDGADGFSPTVTIENVDFETGGTRVSITDKNGTQTFTVWNGLDGEDGAGTNRRIWYTNQNGSDLQLEITAISNLEGAVAASKDTVAVGDIVICKKDNAVLYVEVVTDTLVGFGYIYGYVNVVAGADGKDGQDGKDGADGFSPTVQFTYFTDPHTARLWITDKNGEKYTDIVSPEVSVTEIESGHRITVKDVGGTKTFNVMDGDPGADGFSPTVSVTEIEGGHQISITDKTGTKTFDVLDGAAAEGGNASGTGLQAIQLSSGADLNDLDIASTDMIRVYQDALDVKPANAPPGKESGYCATIINVRTGFIGGHLLQYWIGPADNSKLSGGEVEVYCRSVDPVDKVGLTDWSRVYPASGGAKSWNDLTDRPFYEEGGLVEILPETTVTLSNGEGGLETVLPLVIGDTYVVNWNGTEYSCVAQDLSAQIAGAVALGNLAAIGMTDTGEPFAVANVPGQGTFLISYEELTSATVSIVQGEITIKKLDNKFIDAEWTATPTVGKADIIPETAFVPGAGGNSLATGMSDVIKAGETYTVVYDGTSYECTAVAYPSAFCICIGNAGGKIQNSSISGAPDTGEPFRIEMVTGLSAMVDGTVAIKVQKDDATHTVKVMGEVTIYPELPEQYLPSSVKEGVVTVNTTGSAAISEAQAALESAKYVYFEYNGELYTVLMARESWNDPDSPQMLLLRMDSDERLSYPQFFIYAPEGVKAEDSATLVNPGLHPLFPRLDINGGISLPYVILNSTTSGSTKRFKITVDDSGTLTATEVTA